MVRTERTEEPWEREDNWQHAAIAAAVLLFVGFAVASIWVIVAPTDEARLLHVQIAAPFGVFGGAAVTFFTIVWRGRIAMRQAALQKEQIDRLAAQIAETSENNLADLLQKGAELIAEHAKPAHVAAGIATLQSIATAVNPKFAVEAMNLIADYIQEQHRSQHESVLFFAARSALRAGALLGRSSDRVLTFDAGGTRTGRETSWIQVPGIRFARYFGGVISKDLSYEPEYASVKNHYYRVTVKYLLVDAGTIFQSCNFEHCRIRPAMIARFTENTFRDCDFSGAKLTIKGLLPDNFSEGNNY